jgi:hypothetical protein
LKTLLKKPLVFVGLAAIALSLVYMIFQQFIYLQHPVQPLYVGFFNHSDLPLTSINIDHGNVNTQEKIQLMQLMPGEHRYVALNHEPAMGFNVEVNDANGQKFNACIGRFSDKWHLKVTIDESGIDVTEVW